jgi:hypothetical protein
MLLWDASPPSLKQPAARSPQLGPQQRPISLFIGRITIILHQDDAKNCRFPHNRVRGLFRCSEKEDRRIPSPIAETPTHFYYLFFDTYPLRPLPQALGFVVHLQ